MNNRNQKTILVLICTLAVLFLGFNIEVNAQNDALHIDKDGNVGIGTTKPTKQLDVVGDINATETCAAKTFKATETCAAKTFEGYGTIPIGGIIMWSGTTIPDGWALCNRENERTYNTPDLTDSFIVGAGRSYRISSTGGRSETKLTISNLPTHNHSIDYKRGRGGEGWAKSNTTGSYYTNCSQTLNKETTNTTGVTKSVGRNEPYENRPPYYALAFIMRVK